jgi:hypothetical protein
VGGGASPGEGEEEALGAREPPRRERNREGLGWVRCGVVVFLFIIIIILNNAGNFQSF